MKPTNVVEIIAFQVERESKTHLHHQRVRRRKPLSSRACLWILLVLVLAFSSVIGITLSRPGRHFLGWDRDAIGKGN